MIAIATEEWRPVAGFEGHYEVSAMGVIRSVRGRELKPRISSRGYGYVTLGGPRLKCRRRGVSVHSIVAAAFVGPVPEGLQVNHIDGKKLNNCASNLEYVTPRENTLHQYRIGLRKRRPGGSTCVFAKLTHDQVRAIRAAYSHLPTMRGRTRAYREVGVQFGVSGCSIREVLLNKFFCDVK